MGVTIPAYYCKHIWIGNANVPNSYGADSLMGEFVWLDQIIIVVITSTMVLLPSSTPNSCNALINGLKPPPKNAS